MSGDDDKMGLLLVVITHMTVRDAIQLMEAAKPPDGVIRRLIYVRISLDDKHDEHGITWPNDLWETGDGRRQCGYDGRG